MLLNYCNKQCIILIIIHFYFSFQYFESLLTFLNTSSEPNSISLSDSTISTFVIHILFLLCDNEETKKKCIEYCIKVILTVYYYFIINNLYYYLMYRFPLSIENLYMQFPVFSIIKYQNMLSTVKRYNRCYYLFQNLLLLLKNANIKDYYGLIIGIKQYLDEFIKNKESLKNNKKVKLSNKKSNPISTDTISSFITLFEIIILYSIDKYQPEEFDVNNQQHFNTPYDELISIINDLFSFISMIQSEQLCGEIAIESTQSFYTNLSYILINQVDRIDRWRNSVYIIYIFLK